MSARKETFNTLGELFLQSCEKYADLVAYKYRPRFRTLVWTYEKLKRHAMAFADTLGEHGVGKGDRVLLVAYNSPYWAAAFFGIQLRGAVAVPLPPESKADFVRKIVEQTEAKVLFRNEFVSLESVGVRDVIMEKVAKLQEEKKIELPSLGGDDLAEIVYTSGTTGFPKGVMLTHGNILASLVAAREVIPVNPTLRFVSILPLFHMFEQLGGLIVPLSAGAQVSHAASLNPNHLRWIFQEDRPNRMLAVPEFLRLIYRRLQERAREEGKEKLLKKMLKIAKHLPMALRRKLFGKIHRTFGWEMHTIASGGAPLEPEVGEFWEGIGVYILQGYGLTETAPLLTVNRYHDRKIDSVGKPVRGVEVKIVQGEVLAKGPNVFKGYWRDEEKTKEAFDEAGWYKTGDIGEFDGDGHVHLKGRKKFMIVLPSGEKAHPEDIERELNKEEGVVDSAVLGIAANGEERVHAVLLLEPETKRQTKDIVEAANKRLTNFQKVQSWTVWKEADFPRTPTKKVKRHEVKPVVEAELALEKAEPRTSASTVQGKLYSSGSSPLDALIAKTAEKPLGEIIGEKRLMEDLGMDSLKRVELVARIEAAMNVSVDEGEIGMGTTVQQLKEIVTKRVHKQVRYPFKAGHFTDKAAFWRGILFLLLLTPLARVFTPMRVEGAERLKNVSFPAVFYANHLSTVDAAVIYAALPARVRKRLAALAATDVIYEESAWWIAKFRGLLEFLFALVPMARQGGQVKSSLEYAGRALDHGYSLLVFPEGQMSRIGEPLPFKQGAGFLGVEAKVPLVPIKLEGTAHVIAPGPMGDPPVWKWPRRARVRVTVGEPFVLPEGISYEDATAQMQRRLREL